MRGGEHSSFPGVWLEIFEKRRSFLGRQCYREKGGDIKGLKKQAEAVRRGLDGVSKSRERAC